MPKKKVAVALSDWLLDELDRAAEFSHVSRSALVEEAVSAYVVRRRTIEGDARLRADIDLALEDMRAFAAEVAADADEPPSLEKLRALRAGWRGARG